MDDLQESDLLKNFRSLSVSPTVEDLCNSNPCLRASQIKDPYDSIEHYLDVQFNLLREDFICPLRRGLNQYTNSSSQGGLKNRDVRVYKEVQLVASIINKIRKNIGIKVFFGSNTINWENTKRFTPGGLVMLSSDNFENIIFATVLETDVKRLNEGYVFIQPCNQTDITREMYNDSYVMLESKIYFEPYKAVLAAMQLMDDKNFPMKKYLVDATTKSNPPKYLKNESLFHEVDTPWQTSLKSKFDISQYNAFKHALSEEFAVIQGPPGTGKTFIALEIVQTLLKIKELWLPDGPIVVVCFTNHALDQFLEGIINHTESIIRLGGRSKSEILKPYTLKKKRQQSIDDRNSRSGNFSSRRNLFKAKTTLECTLGELSNANCLIKYLTTSEAIVPLKCLTRYCSDKTLRKIKSNKDLIEWLIEEQLDLVIQELDNVDQNHIVSEEVLNETIEENEQVDDFVELASIVDIPDGYLLTYPIMDIDLKLEEIKEKTMLCSRLNHRFPNPFCTKETNHWKMCEKKLTEKKKNLEKEFLNHPILYPEKQTINGGNDRWKMYWSWVKESYSKAEKKLKNLKLQYHQENREFNDAKQLADLDILKKHEIIGLTTSCAARLHLTLHGLHAPIVIVEEAAEILESHVVCSLTKDSQHVILIGDHKQLRPKPSEYRIAKDFNLEISLFERMVNIRGSCNQLTRQHRMRPEIVKLLTPSIYNTLESDQSVYEFPNVKGLNVNLFFFNHENYEITHNEVSYSNQYEAKFLINWANYLVLQGYDVKDITILTPYMGQLFELKNEKNKFMILKNLYVTTVDNYQGQENRIILLSLVRSNGKGIIGFLSEENRVCVALSRAREGLYIMGNMNDLVMKNNKIWPKLKNILEDQKAIGETLPLRCQNHPDELINIKKPDDFQLCSPEGGCLKPCNFKLNCGHVCNRVCHVIDREHKQYQCTQPCTKSCPEGHPCPLNCWEPCQKCCLNVKCTLMCGHEVEKPCSVIAEKFLCNYKVKITFPECGHEVEKPCFIPTENWVCTHPCEVQVKKCGHSCLLNCHVKDDPDHITYICRKECTKKCENQHSCIKPCYQDYGVCPVVMKKVRSCGHTYLVSCFVNIEQISCQRVCKRKLPCGHNCLLNCSDHCGNCSQKVKKILTCGHEVYLKCGEDNTPAKCSAMCTKRLSCGHLCNQMCKDPCTAKCKDKVKLSEPGVCGHIFSVPCHLRDQDSKNPVMTKYCQTCQK